MSNVVGIIEIFFLLSDWMVFSRSMVLWLYGVSLRCRINSLVAVSVKSPAEVS